MNDPQFGMDSTRSWVVAAFLSLVMSMTMAGQQTAGVLFYGIVHTYGVSRQEASWPIVLTTTVTCLTVGVLFYGIVHTYDVSREEASWPLALTHSLAFLAGPVMGYLCSRFSCQVVLFVSTLTAGASVCSCFFADSIFSLNILFGIIHGTAACGVHVAVSVIVSQHFEKRRTTAYSVIYTAMCINSVYLPPLAELFRVTYGVRGTFLLLGGMVLNSFPPVLAVQSPEWTKQKKRSLGNSRGIQDGNFPDDAEMSHGKVEKTKFAEVPIDQNGDFSLKAVPLLSSNNELMAKDSAASPSFTLIARQFISIPFAVNAISFCVIGLGMSTFILLAVDIAVDRGIAPSSGVFLLNAFAVTDIVARPLSGVVIDSGLYH
ncbi:hypothetical protein HPB49_008366 [Dermacentor silvarum]|uniref:Uncharacterized protein n=1 Tax=Dermacentor silvarum TaxID=543639 RepID=A0ACB8CE08_DERSI|nr:hypothetical protein HPB49_008366 [Dermacentor silvarum]